jgi:hypothetical protein
MRTVLLDTVGPIAQWDTSDHRHELPRGSKFRSKVHFPKW